MIVAYHLIFTAYGFWLPNDPRGSWSEFVATWDLLLAGVNRAIEYVNGNPERAGLPPQRWSFGTSFIR